MPDIKVTPYKERKSSSIISSDSSPAPFYASSALNSDLYPEDDFVKNETEIPPFPRSNILYRSFIPPQDNDELSHTNPYDQSFHGSESNQPEVPLTAVSPQPVVPSEPIVPLPVAPTEPAPTEVRIESPIREMNGKKKSRKKGLRRMSISDNDTTIKLPPSDSHRLIIIFMTHRL